MWYTGTGELTKFIADLVGDDGEVVGVYPDKARIRLGQENFKDVANLAFLVGRSESGFAHDKDEYYDLHFGNGVLHWLKRDERKVYMRQAYQCMKPCGRIAIRTRLVQHNVVSEAFKDSFESTGKEGYEQLLHDFGPFNVNIEVTKNTHHFASFEELSAWVSASAKKVVDAVEIREFFGLDVSQEVIGD